MEMKNKQLIEEILNKNPDIRERMDSWSISYDKRADFLIFGESFTADSAYVLLSETDGIMVRVNSSNKILGFAIENTKMFIKNNPGESLALRYFVYPVRTKMYMYMFGLMYRSKDFMDEFKKGIGNVFIPKVQRYA